MKYIWSPLRKKSSPFFGKFGKSSLPPSETWYVLKPSPVFRIPFDNQWIGGRVPTMQTGIYLLKLSNVNTKTMCEICSTLTIRTSKECQKRRSRRDLNFVWLFSCLSWFSILTIFSSSEVKRHCMWVKYNSFDWFREKEKSEFKNRIFYIQAFNMKSLR